MQVDELEVRVAADAAGVGRLAAEIVADVVRRAVEARGDARVIFATGNSQLPFVTALRAVSDVPWSAVTAFHMDEYVGLPADHPASFRRWIAERVERPLGVGTVNYLLGDAPDPQAEAERYSGLIRERPIDLVVMGIGENGHIAFNEPGSDQHDRAWARVVTLDEKSRRQQVGEGHFATVADVPERAITLTIPALLSPAHVVVGAPEARKAEAVRRALTGSVAPDSPASALRTKAGAILLLDPDSARLL